MRLQIVKAGLLTGLIILLFCALPSATFAGSFCPSFPSSELYRARTRQVVASPSNWISLIEGARSGDEVLLVNGIHDLDHYSVQIGTDITIRGASGSRASVLIQG